MSLNVILLRMIYDWQYSEEFMFLQKWIFFFTSAANVCP